MTEIIGGNTHDDSTAEDKIISDGGTSKITLGHSYDRSHRSLHVLDLKDPADLAIVATQLSIFAGQLGETLEGKAHPEDIAALKQAAIHAAAGQRDSVKESLSKVGKWVLHTATAIGTPVAIEFLKSQI